MENLVAIRYLILLLALFATYCGLLYNEMMSLPVNGFESCYVLEGPHSGTLKEDCVYPFGVDSVWIFSANDLQFVNSLKMKLAVILGVLHMSLGVVLKGFNAVYFKNYLEFYNEFIPQLLLLWFLFGYMDILIIIKWLTNYEG